MLIFEFHIVAICLQKEKAYSVAFNLLVHSFHKTCQEHVILHFKIIFKSVHKKSTICFRTAKICIKCFPPVLIARIKKIDFCKNFF